MRQIQYIKDITVNIYNNKLEIRFLCDEQLNKEELETFDFIESVFKGIRAFTKKVGLEYKVFINVEEWKY